MNWTKALLSAGMAMPLVYFGALLVAGLFYPEYSHIKQQPSELGAENAPYDFALMFNLSLVLSGLLGLSGALGVAVGLLKLQAGKLLAMITGLTPALPSLALILAGAFPLPSPYHGSLLLYVAGIFFPILGWVSLRHIEGLLTIKLILIVAFIACLIVVGVILGVGGLIHADNIGLWLRIWAVCSFPTITLMCFVIWRELASR